MSELAKTVQQQREQWLKDLQEDLKVAEADIETKQGELTKLRQQRDVTKAMIRELTPRKARNGDATSTVGVEVTEAAASA